MSVIVVEDLRKSYGKVAAVAGISFEVQAGELFGLLGPNGAGKTTTTEVLEGLLLPDAGRVEVLGFDVRNQLRAIQQRIGIQLQSTALFRRLRVREQIELFASFYERALPVDEVLRLIGLEDKAQSLCTELSGGQKQRLAIGLGLVNEPDILFLDEPTTGLDPQARAHLLKLISELRARGKTIFMTTHYMEDAERLCDRIAIMDRGRIIACESPRALIEQHFEYALVEVDSAMLTEGELSKIPAVRQVQRIDGTLVLHTKQPAEVVGACWETAKSSGADIRDLRIRRASLDDVFLSLTGRPIRN